MACKELGVHGDGISAELHNMLLYEGKAMSKHHDASKSVDVNDSKNNDEPVKVNELEKNDRSIDFG
jgi:hypothetical protein